MTKAEAYTFDPETLRNKSVSQICDLVMELIGIIRDQDQEIQTLEEEVTSLEDDGK
ncbi:MAG: hypothetical protein IJ058_13480 [Lachnospiraceae bacterium]|nr:hypothetical protein [Lachnospiraceae bacterium]